MSKKFRIWVDYNELFSIEQLWPDGDAPENPTVKDVLELIEDCGGLGQIISDWNLERDMGLSVTEVKTK